MKIRYEFVNGDVMEIEVDDEIGMTILQSRKEESSDGRQYRRQTLSLDTANDKSSWVKTDEHNPDSFLDREELEEMRQRRSEEIREIMNQLSDKQTELAQAMHDKKFTQEDYAEKKGVSQSAISQQIRTLRKKFRKFL